MIPKWILKAMVQGVIAHLPRRQWINYQFQKSVTKSLDPSRDTLERRLRWCGEHLAHYRKYSENGALPESVLELGTGWFPTIPVGLFLCGIPRIVSIDTQSLINQDYFMGMLHALGDYPAADLKQVIPELREGRLVQLKRMVATSASRQEILAAMNISLIVGDARGTEFPDATWDFVISNTTLEHIAYRSLIEIFHEFRRIISRRGLMSHLIDLSDHYQHFDHSITGYNYLQYSDFVWQLLNNTLLFQNRLREPDYRKIHLAAGFRIVAQFNRSGSAAELGRLKLAKRFQTYSQEELLVQHAWVISAPAILTQATK